MMNFNLYSQYYDLIYNSKDYKAEAELVFVKMGLQSPKILDLGCGSGGHASVFSKLNCSITGLDLSESMVDLANRKSIPNFIAKKANIEQFELEDQFDAAISMFHVISYLTDNKSILNCLTCVNRHLKPGGIFIFDFWFAPAVYHQGFEHRIKTFENNEIKVTRDSTTLLDINKNIGVVGFDILVESKKDKNLKQRIVEQHPMRFFSIPEIRNFANQTGYDVVEFFDLQSNNKPSLETWAITVKFVKI
jgi:SAM-dependent methyltransferase